MFYGGVWNKFPKNSPMGEKRERRKKRKRYLLKWWTVWTGGNEYPFGVIAKPVKPCKPLYVA